MVLIGLNYISVSLKKKHQDAIYEMSEQIDQLNKMKGRSDHNSSIYTASKILKQSLIF